MRTAVSEHWLYEPAGNGAASALTDRTNPSPTPIEASQAPPDFNRAAAAALLGRAALHGQSQCPAPRLGWLPRFAQPAGRKLAREAARLVRRTCPRQERFNGTVLEVLRIALDLLGPRLDNVDADLADLRDRVESAEADVRQLGHEVRYALADLREAVRTQDQRLSLLLAEAGRPPAGPPVAAARPLSVGDRDYVQFEDQFRGTREEVRRRLAVYLDVLAAARAGTPDRPVLDVGPGRGEWLELLRERGWRATGVDQNPAMVRDCRDRGLAVVAGDALSHLQGLPTDGLGAVTAFHVVEHLPPDLLPAFLTEIARVVAPGGVTILETPNPENLITSACDFYRDPTHVRPLHPDTLQFLAERHGLVRVRIVRLSEHRLPDPPELVPWHHPLAEHLNPLIEVARRRLFVAPDYAVIGYKPGV